MLEKEHFHILNYVKKEEYTGSMSGMRYMIKKISSEEMEVTIWPEPYAYAYTDEALKTRRNFPLSEEGIMDVCDYLNEQYETQKSLWGLSKKTV